jgi:phage FluMu protein Com
MAIVTPMVYHDWKCPHCKKMFTTHLPEPGEYKTRLPDADEFVKTRCHHCGGDVFILVSRNYYRDHIEGKQR